MAEIKFVNVTGTNSGNFVHLVNLARQNKNCANTIIKVVKNIPGNKLTIEIWRREGAVDCFLVKHNDLFDRVIIKDNCAKSAPLGALVEQNLTVAENCDILMSATIVSERSFPGVIEKIAGKYDFACNSNQIKENRCTIPEIMIEI